MTTLLPELLLDESVAAWSDTADVIVIGYGMAGACATIEARQAGADVMVIERAAGSGGSSALAGGHFYLGGGTPVQAACGIEDSAEEMYKYLAAVSPQPDHAKLRLYCEQSVAHFHWLESQGIPFERSYHPEKVVIQEGRECLIWSGNEKAWPFREQAKPAPRGHKVAIEGEQGGAVAMRALTQKVEESGARVQYNARATALIADRSGRVVGVRVKYAEEVRYLRALKGLILTAGGFNMNNEMVEQYVPHLAQVVRHGTPNDDGSGILLGLSAGGVLNHMDGALITSPIYPPASLLQGIVVNNQGNRFVAEDVYHGRLSAFTLEQPESKAYLILDSETFAYPEYKLQPLIDGWDTVEEMEMALQLPRGSLQCTLDDYNRHAQAGEDPIFHKHSDWIRPLNNAPYAAFDLSLGTATYLSGLTLGGLRVSTDGAVLAKTGMPIAGLYAAGACASNVAQDGAGYASGTCLGQASFFGRCAGRHAARQRG